MSLYGGIVDLPLIIRREGEEAGWFADRASLIEERLWAERDGRLRGETERLAAELRDNVIGREVWPRLRLGTRSFLATAEAVFRRHRDDPHFDFATAAIEYAKAIEVEVNARAGRPRPRHRRPAQPGRAPRARQFRRRLVPARGVPRRGAGRVDRAAGQAGRAAAGSPTRPRAHAMN